MKEILIIKQATGHILAAGRFPHSEKSFFSFSRSEVSFPPVSLKLEEQVRSWAAPSSRAATLTGSRLVIRVFLFFYLQICFYRGMFVRHMLTAYTWRLIVLRLYSFDCIEMYWHAICHWMTRFCWWTTVASHGFLFIVLCINDYHL